MPNDHLLVRGNRWRRSAAALLVVLVAVAGSTVEASAAPAKRGGKVPAGPLTAETLLGAPAWQTSAAYDPGTRVHLIVNAPGGRSPRVRVSRVRSDGSLVDATPLVAPYFSQFPPLLEPAVTWDSDQFQVLFDGGDGIYGFDVSPTAGITRLGVRRVTVGHTDTHPAIASAGGRSVVAFDTSRTAGDSGVYLTRLDADGAPIITPDFLMDGITPVSLTGREPSLASNGTDHVVAWQETRHDGGDIYAARVSADGVLVSAPVAVASGAGVQGSPAVTWSGGNWSIAYTHEDPAGGRDIRLADLSVATPPPVASVDVATGSADQHSPSVAFDGAKVTVAWVSGSSALLRQLTPSGASPLAVDATTVLVSDRMDTTAAMDGRAMAISAGASHVIQVAYARADGLFTRQFRPA